MSKFQRRRYRKGPESRGSVDVTIIVLIFSPFSIFFTSSVTRTIELDVRKSKKTEDLVSLNSRRITRLPLHLQYSSTKKCAGSNYRKKLDIVQDEFLTARSFLIHHHVTTSRYMYNHVQAAQRDLQVTATFDVHRTQKFPAQCSSVHHDDPACTSGLSKVPCVFVVMNTVHSLLNTANVAQRSIPVTDHGFVSFPSGLFDSMILYCPCRWRDRSLD